MWCDALMSCRSVVYVSVSVLFMALRHTMCCVKECTGVTTPLQSLLASIFNRLPYSRLTLSLKPVIGPNSPAMHFY